MIAAILLYSIKSALVLAMLYLPYMLMLRRESFFRFNRMMLLGILLLSLVLPLCNVPGMSLDRQPVVQAAQLQMLELGIPVHVLPEVKIVADGVVRHGTSRFSLFLVVSLIYIIGMGMLLLMRLWQVGRLQFVLRRGALWQQEEQGIRIYCHTGDVAPFSWMRSIVISQQDFDEAGREIILHETGHIRNGHSWDVVLLTVVQMVQWWNPLAYALGISLRDVHEYEADDYVLQQGVSAQGYQLLLIKKAVGSGSYAFANSFNHSLTKKRITMMKKSKSNPWMRSKALYAIPVAALALSAFATPKFVAPIESAVSKLAGMSTENVDEKLVSFKPGDPSRIGFTILKGTWVEQEVYGEDSSYIEENTTKTPYLPVNSVTIKLDGKVVDVNDLCDMPASVLKKFEKKFPGREINLVTTDEKTDGKMIKVKDGTLSVVVDGKEMTPHEAIKAVQGKEIHNSLTTQPDGSTALSIKTKERVKKEGKETLKDENFSGEAAANSNDDKNLVAKSDSIYDRPAVNAEYPGGEGELFKFLMENLRYPHICQYVGFQGRLHVNFVVEKDGSITEIKKLKGPGQTLSETTITAFKKDNPESKEVLQAGQDLGDLFYEEAVRVIKLMPKWVPAKDKDGNPVRCHFTVPFMFRLN